MKKQHIALLFICGVVCVLGYRWIYSGNRTMPLKRTTYQITAMGRQHKGKTSTIKLDIQTPLHTNKDITSTPTADRPLFLVFWADHPLLKQYGLNRFVIDYTFKEDSPWPLQTAHPDEWIKTEKITVGSFKDVTFTKMKLITKESMYALNSPVVFEYTYLYHFPLEDAILTVFFCAEKDDNEEFLKLKDRVINSIRIKII